MSGSPGGREPFMTAVGAMPEGRVRVCRCLPAVVVGYLFGDDDGQLDDAGYCPAGGAVLGIAGGVACLLVPGCLVDEFALAFLADGVRVGDSFGEDAGDDACPASGHCGSRACTCPACPRSPPPTSRSGTRSRTSCRTPSPRIPRI